MKVRVEITRRPEIADPQGSTVLRALRDLGHSDVTSVRVDRVIHLEVEGADPVAVKAGVENMCRQVLANPVPEDFAVEVNQ